MSWLYDIVIGSISSGVNKPTVIAINLALVSCIGTVVALAFIGAPTDLLLHLGVLAALAFGLLCSVNWVLSETGVVSVEQQKKELFGDDHKQQIPEGRKTD